MNDLEYKLRIHRSEVMMRIGHAAIKWGSLCFISWRLGLALEAFAGRSTLANFGIFLVADLKVNKVFSHIIMGLFGVGGVGYGVNERRLRRKVIKQSGGRIAKLENRLDPKRTSSGLRVDGRSRPEDEP
jgi:hypothetical protein